MAVILILSVPARYELAIVQSHLIARSQTASREEPLGLVLLIAHIHSRVVPLTTPPTLPACVSTPFSSYRPLTNRKSLLCRSQQGKPIPVATVNSLLRIKRDAESCELDVFLSCFKRNLDAADSAEKIIGVLDKHIAATSS